MNEELAIAEVEAFLRDLQRFDSSGGNSFVVEGRRPELVQAEEAINARRPLIEEIAAEVSLKEIDRLRDHSASWWYKTYAAAQELKGVLLGRERREAVMGDSGPKLSANNLHPWVWTEAAPRWDAGFYRDAVQSAATRIFDVELPKKLGVRPSSNPADLFAAFAPDRKKGTVLRFPDIDPDDPTWANVHKGAMHVGQGCVASIRNPRTHRLSVGQEQTVLEELATLSLLARWVDDAEAVPAI